MESNKFIVAVDCDEVLAEFVKGLCLFHNDKYGTQLTIRDFHSYEFSEVWGGDTIQALRKVEEYIASRFFKELGVVPHSQQVLQDLTASKLFEFVVVTSRQSSLEGATRNWVSAHFPNVFTDVKLGNHYGTGHKISKPEMCKQIGCRVIIDDSLKYAVECANAGIKVLLFDSDSSYPWNKIKDKKPEELQHITRVTNWHQAKEELLKLAENRA